MLTDAQKRQQVHDKIKKAGSKTKFIYAEMKRLGFWTDKEPDFSGIQAYFDKERELVQELHKLLVEKKKIDNPEFVLKQIHERRKEESKKRHAENKQKREELRRQKAERWSQIKKEEIIYLGKGYSKGLQQKLSDFEKLGSLKLPELHDAKDLANAMGIEVAELRFLSFSRKNSPVNHYVRFTIPKRSGGTRTISAPRPRLKEAQHWILKNILNQLEVHEAAQGCVAGRSIKSNAEKHVNQHVVVNQDLKNFFPTISYLRIRGLFRSLGYGGQVSTILALICSEPEIAEIDVYGEKLFSQRTERFLPQGSPCSPAITNIICRKLDQRLSGMAKKYGFTYTRYVDDITLSSPKESAENLKFILMYSKKIITDEGFELNSEKLRVMRKGNSQHVTGLLVNEKANVHKKTLKKFRALIHHVEKDGIEGKQWNGSTSLLDSMHGYASFIQQINPSLGEPYLKRVKAILVKYNHQPQNPYAKKKEPVLSDNGQKQQVQEGFFSKLRKLFSKK